MSGKELQRQLGATCKTAYRMGQQIRTLMQKADHFDGLLTGHVEMDEAYVGGKSKGSKHGRGAPGKTMVVGMAQRDGRFSTQVIPDVKKDTLRKVVQENVAPGSIVSTDGLMSYGLLAGDGFTHGKVKHGKGEFAKSEGGVSFHVNTVEGFWHLFKASVGQPMCTSASSTCSAIRTSSLSGRTTASA